MFRDPHVSPVNLVSRVHRPQVGAVREGLGVFVNDELRASLRRCCTVADIQLLMCGVAEIDVEDWRTSTEYVGPGASSRPIYHGTRASLL
mgnify:CR=1 FL=1